MNRRFWAALALAAALIALAFFLPPQISRWEDRKIMDQPRITRVEDREGLADSLGLTVAEKLLRMQEGDLSYLSLPGEGAQVRYTIEEGTGHVYVSSEPEQRDPAEEDEVAGARLTAVLRELLILQRSGALPQLWREDVQAELTDSGEILCIDNNTQLSFLICHASLSLPNGSAGVTYDQQSGKILSLSLRWLRDQPPSWGAAGAANFGGAWRDYWGMDSVDPGWSTVRIKEILSTTPPLAGSGDYTAAGEITFTYDGQELRAPVYSWGSSGTCALQWNT